MGAYRADALILEIDVCRRSESLFKSICTHERSTSVIGISLTHFIRYLYPSVSLVEFLACTFLTEQLRQIRNCYRFLCLGIKHGHRLHRHIRLDVIPAIGDHILRQHEFFLSHSLFV